MSIENFNIRNMERMMKAHFNDKHGLVTSYDEKTHKGKVTYMPSGEESGWLPIEESHVGNGWGMLVGLTPGSGQGSGMGGAGSSGDDGSSGGGSGGGGGGGGGGGQSQYQGDQVIVRFQEGQLNTGKIVKRLHSKVDKPPKVKSGEMLHMHSLGGRMFFDEKGQVHMYDKTSKQDDQMGQGGSGGGGSGGGGSGGPSPLKGPPPSEPQSVHLMWDGKGKSTMTHYQQDQRQSGQDGQDPNSEKSPSPYARRSISGKDMTHDHVTYQEQQSGGSGASGGGAGAGAGGSGSGSGSGSGGSGNNMQVEPGKPGSGKDSAMFARVKSDSKKGTHETTMYQKGGQSGSEKMLHKVSMDRGGESITVTHFENGSDNKKFEMKMDGKGGKCSMTAFQGGQEMGSTTWDNSGNIGHKSKGVHSVNAQRMHINCDTHVQGGVNAQGTVTSASGIGAPTVSGSPGSVTGVSGGSKSPLE